MGCIGRVDDESVQVRYGVQSRYGTREGTLSWNGVCRETLFVDLLSESKE